MGKQQSKEETVIVQNAAGGVNQANLDEFKFHLTTTNLLLGIIVMVIILGILYFIYRLYQRCHIQWIHREINDRVLRRSFFRRPDADNSFSTPMAPSAPQ